MVLTAPSFSPPALFAANAVQVYDVLAADRIVIEKEALAYINEYYGGKEE